MIEKATYNDTTYLPQDKILYVGSDKNETMQPTTRWPKPNHLKEYIHLILYIISNVSHLITLNRAHGKINYM